MEDRQWYVVQTYSGFESSVRDDLLKRKDSMGMEDLIFEVVIPEETVEEKTKTGKIKQKVVKMYPGYVFIEMIVTDESWFIVRNTPKVTGFLGSSGGGTKPVPLPESEMKAVLQNSGLIAKPTNDVKVGEMVRVVSGSFAGSEGKIESINDEKETITILVPLFAGQYTPTEVSVYDIEKV